MKAERFFPHFITLVLLALGAVYKSPALGYASVLSLGLLMIRETYEKIMSDRLAKVDGTDEVKKLVQGINARVATLEYGVKQRGF